MRPGGFRPPSRSAPAKPGATAACSGAGYRFGERYYRYDAETRADGTVRSSVPRAAIAEEQAAAFFTRTDALPGFIRAPTLIVRATVGLLGDNRGHILPRPEAERLLAAIPGSRLIEIPETDHYTVVLADGFAPEVTTFLAEGPKREGPS